jgi:hypothetical protein
MMKNVSNTIVWFLLFLVAVVFFSCKRTNRAGEDEIVINGKLTNSAGKIIWLSEFDGKRMHIIDSAYIEADEFFSFKIKPKYAGFFIVSLLKNDDAFLIGNKGETIMLTGDANHLASSWNARGSDETKLYLTYWDATRNQLKHIDSLTILFRSIRMDPDNMTLRIRTDSIFTSIMERQREDATHFINKNPGALASLLVINAKFLRQPLFYEERDINYFKMLDSGLSLTYPGNPLEIDFHNRVKQILKSIKNHQLNNRLLPPGELSPSYTPNR